MIENVGDIEENCQVILGFEKIVKTFNDGYVIKIPDDLNSKKYFLKLKFPKNDHSSILLHIWVGGKSSLWIQWKIILKLKQE